MVSVRVHKLVGLMVYCPVALKALKMVNHLVVNLAYDTAAVMGEWLELKLVALTAYGMAASLVG